MGCGWNLWKVSETYKSGGCQRPERPPVLFGCLAPPVTGCYRLKRVFLGCGEGAEHQVQKVQEKKWARCRDSQAFWGGMQPRAAPATPALEYLRGGAEKHPKEPAGVAGGRGRAPGSACLTATPPPGLRPLCHLAARRRSALAIGRQSGGHKKSRSKRLVGAFLGAWCLPGFGQGRRHVS